MFLEKLRNKLYWLVDILKFKQVKKHLEEINLILDNPESLEAQKIRNIHLNKLLNHATYTTGYYSEYKNYKDIFDFPVIKKTVIQDNFEKFQSLLFKNKKNFKVSTSGSTGIPFFLFQDKNKRNRNKADTIFFLNQCNYKIGYKFYNLAVRLKPSKKTLFISKLKNVLLIDISKLNDKKIFDFLSILRNHKKSSKVILGYVSGFETIIQYLKKNNLKVDDIKLKSIIANSEYLSQQTKNTLSNYFNTPVLSRYSSEEVGIIAHQTINSPNTFVVNHASYFIELLNFENNKPVKPGEFGRIVITDLFNYAMPLIRYDTGDVAKLKINNNSTIEFEEVEGRKLDTIYDTKGNKISSYLVYTKIYTFYHLIKQYQFIQNGEKDYEIKLNIHGDKFEFEKEIIEDVKKDFGQDANIYFTYVNEIPALASGKRRKVVNNFHKN